MQIFACLSSLCETTFNAFDPIANAYWLGASATHHFHLHLTKNELVEIAFMYIQNCSTVPIHRSASLYFWLSSGFTYSSQQNSRTQWFYIWKQNASQFRWRFIFEWHVEYARMSIYHVSMSKASYIALIFRLLTITCAVSSNHMHTRREKTLN